jgi:mono/diheme cytochrome c family protein
MNMRTLLPVVGVITLGFSITVNAGQAKPAAPTQASLDNGAALFKRQCVMCHGAAGLGDGPAAKNLKGKLPSLADKASMSKLTDAQITQAIAEGKKTDIGNMPALGKRLMPEEITDIVNFVRTLAK